MFLIIGIMLTGILVGYLLRNKRLSAISRAITVFIWILLFLLGIEVGANERIIGSIASIGFEAAMVTAAAVLGSALAAWLLWYMIYIRPINKRKEA